MIKISTKSLKVGLIIVSMTIISFLLFKPYQYSLFNSLNYYGFKNQAQKIAVEDLLIKSSIIPKNKTINEVFPPKRTQDGLINDILDFNKKIQEKLVMRSGIKERWEVTAPEWIKQNKEQILSDLKTLGFVDEISAKTKETDAICILGAASFRMLNRINYANSLMKSGLKGKSIILIAGERYVTLGTDGTEDQLINIAKKYNLESWRNLTETHLLKDIYYNSNLPDRNLPVYVIDTPRNELPRPTTETTIIELIKWLKEHQEIKNLIFVSNQPYVKYQQAIINSTFKAYNINLQYQVVGDKALDLDNTQALVEAFGSYIWAESPSILEEMRLYTKNKLIKEELKELYLKNPLIYSTMPASLTK